MRAFRWCKQAPIVQSCGVYTRKNGSGVRLGARLPLQLCSVLAFGPGPCCPTEVVISPSPSGGSSWTPLCPEAARGCFVGISWGTAPCGHSFIHHHCMTFVSEEVFALHSSGLLRAEAFPDLQTHSYHVPWDESISSCCWFSQFLAPSVLCLQHSPWRMAAGPQEHSSESGGGSLSVELSWKELPPSPSHSFLHQPYDFWAPHRGCLHPRVP